MIEPKAARENEKGEEKRGAFRGLRPCLYVFFLACLPISAAAAKYGGGTGTTQTPFLIYTAEDFKTIGDSPADWDKQFKLMRDIDLADYNEVTLHMIGQYVGLGAFGNRPFNGIFDGNRKSISNFRYRNMGQEYVGLFQHVTGEIRDLKLVRPVVVGDKSGTGALVGYLERGGLIRCTATDISVSGNFSVGGLVGLADGAVSMSCSDGEVFGIRFVGGLIGQIGKGVAVKSYSKAQVAGTDSVGGLVGMTGLVESIVDSCYARGDVKGTVYVAGLVGQVSAGRVFRCYSTGKVTGDQSPGGLVGYQRALAQVIGSLWDTQTSKQAKSVGGTGKTTAEMKSMDTFLAMNWDFFNTWTICEGINYPVFLWQIPPGDLVCPDGVNFRDFAWFAVNWRHRNCGAANLNCDGTDLDKSGSVEFRDLAIFAENWLAGVE